MTDYQGNPEQGMAISLQSQNLLLRIAENIAKADYLNQDDIHQMICIRGLGVIQNNPDKPMGELEPMLVSVASGERYQFYRDERRAAGISRFVHTALRDGTKTEHELVSEGYVVDAPMSLDFSPAVGEAPISEMISDDNDEQAKVLDELLANQILNCFDETDPKQAKLRHVLVEYFFEDRTLKEIAKDLGVTEGRVSQMLSEAKAYARETISS